MEKIDIKRYDPSHAEDHTLMYDRIKGLEAALIMINLVHNEGTLNDMRHDLVNDILRSLSCE